MYGITRHEELSARNEPRRLYCNVGDLHFGMNDEEVCRRKSVSSRKPGLAWNSVIDLRLLYPTLFPPRVLSSIPDVGYTSRCFQVAVTLRDQHILADSLISLNRSFWGRGFRKVGLYQHAWRIDRCVVDHSALAVDAGSTRCFSSTLGLSGILGGSHFLLRW